MFACMESRLAPEVDKTAMLRKKVHKIADKLVDDLAPSLVGDKSLTMLEISELFEDLKPQLLSSLLESFATLHHLEVTRETTAPCPQCGTECRMLRQTTRHVETRHGKITFQRPYFLCSTCKTGFIPLDQVLELSGRRKQYDLQRLALDYIAEVPYARAAELFEKSTGISFSTDSLHELLGYFASSLTPEACDPGQGDH